MNHIHSHDKEEWDEERWDGGCWREFSSYTIVDWKSYALENSHIYNRKEDKHNDLLGTLMEKVNVSLSMTLMNNDDKHYLNPLTQYSAAAPPPSRSGYPLT